MSIEAKAVDQLQKLEVAAVKYTTGLAQRAGKALQETGDHLLSMSQEIVPVDTGELKDGGFCRVDSGTGGFNTVVVVGYVAPYAVYVHEVTWFYHEPPTQAKYLETPLRTRRDELAATFNRTIRGF